MPDLAGEGQGAGAGGGEVIVGNEIGGGEPIEQKLLRAPCADGIFGHVALALGVAVGKQAAGHGGGVLFHPDDDLRVKAFDAVKAGVIGEHGHHFFAEVGVVFLVFHLDDHRDLSGDDLQHLREQHYDK